MKQATLTNHLLQNSENRLDYVNPSSSQKNRSYRKWKIPLIGIFLTGEISFLVRLRPRIVETTTTLQRDHGYGLDEPSTSAEASSTKIDAANHKPLQPIKQTTMYRQTQMKQLQLQSRQCQQHQQHHYQPRP